MEELIQEMSKVVDDFKRSEMSKSEVNIAFDKMEEIVFSAGNKEVYDAIKTYINGYRILVNNR